MHVKLNQFTRKDVWYLVHRPEDCNIVGTKLIFKNKRDNQGIITRNKAM